MHGADLDQLPIDLAREGAVRGRLREPPPPREDRTAPGGRPPNPALSPALGPPTDRPMPARAAPELYEPIVSGGPDVLAQARYAVEHEAAVTVDDILRRRTTVALRGLEAEGRVDGHRQLGAIDVGKGFAHVPQRVESGDARVAAAVAAPLAAVYRRTGRRLAGAVALAATLAAVFFGVGWWAGAGESVDAALVHAVGRSLGASLQREPA